MNPLRQRIRTAIGDANLQTALDRNAQRRKAGRLAAFALVPDREARRARAHAIKAEVVGRLEEHVARFVARVEANGIVVHRAKDGAEAVRLAIGLVREARRKYGAAAGREGPPLVAKAKSMVSEEIELNHAFAAEGIRAVETDLGEYIVQLRGERPSHIITPAVHLQRQDVGRLFAEKLGIPYTEDIPTLTKTARRVLREVFLTADAGVSGVNFGVEETGTLVTVTNEGNGRMCTTVPPVHIALMGLERIVPTMDDLALFLSLLPRSATGQKLSVYTSLMHGPRRGNDADGPRERHLILVDNGRMAMANSPLAEALFCIRCGACLNICPVFREMGGHAYLGCDGAIAPYPGPIGSVVSPGLFGCDRFGHLAQASSLCGACREACPVDIDLPGLLLRVRAGEAPAAASGAATAEGAGLPRAVRWGLKGFRMASGSPRFFGVAQKLAALASILIPAREGWMRLPAATGWGLSKDFPRPARASFRAQWRRGLDGAAAEGPSGGGAPAAATTGTAPVAPPAPAAAAAGTPVERFATELAALGGRAHVVPPGGIQAKVLELLAERGIGRAQAWNVVPGIDEASLAAAGVSITHEAADGIRAGITGVLAGISETGSVIVSGGPGRPLAASLLPEIHVAVMRSDQLVPTLADALALPGVRAAAACAVITGPSRTADIEMTLTIGVHGPGEIHVVLEDAPPSPGAAGAGAMPKSAVDLAGMSR